MADRLSGAARFRVEVLPDAAAWTAAAAREVRSHLAPAVAERGTASLVLAGGSTPRPVYRELARTAERDTLPWRAVEMFFGDERAVPPDHAESNFRMAEETLLSGVGAAAARVHRIRGELGAEEAARRYDDEIRAALGPEPRFDLVLLGLGGDGHTASLFPATFAASAGPGADADPHPGRLAAATEAPEAPRQRITLTLGALAPARAVVFLVRGEGKAGAVREALQASSRLRSGGDPPAPVPPAARVQPRDGELIWMLDRAAAGAGPQGDGGGRG